MSFFLSLHLRSLPLLLSRAFLCLSSCTCLMQDMWVGWGGVGWGGVGGGGDVYVRCHAIDNVVSSVSVVPHVRCHAIDNVVSSVSVPRVPV